MERFAATVNGQKPFFVVGKLFILNVYRSPFYTLRKRQKTKGLLTFSEGVEMEHWAEKG